MTSVPIKYTHSATEEFREKFKNFPEQFVSNLEARGYLAAAIDGEGFIYPRAGHYRVTLTNTDENFLLTCIECYEKHGIKGWQIYRVERSKLNAKHADFYQLVVAYHSDIKRLKKLPLKVQKKKEALESICQKKPRRKKTPKNLERFAKLYNKGVKYMDLMNLFQISESTVTYWIQELDEQGKITRAKTGTKSIPANDMKRYRKQARKPTEEEVLFRNEEIFAEAFDVELDEFETELDTELEAQLEAEFDSELEAALNRSLKKEDNETDNNS